MIVAEGNLMKNQFIDLEEPIDDEQLLKLNLLLNTQLNGRDSGRDQSGNDPAHEAAGGKSTAR